MMMMRKAGLMETRADRKAAGRVMARVIRQLEEAGWRVIRAKWGPARSQDWDFLYSGLTLFPLNEQAAAATRTWQPGVIPPAPATRTPIEPS
jgi:hypothetical protein